MHDTSLAFPSPAASSATDPGAPLQRLRAAFHALSHETCGPAGVPRLPGAAAHPLLQRLVSAAVDLGAEALCLHDAPGAAAIRARIEGRDVPLVQCAPALLQQLQDFLLARAGLDRAAVDRADPRLALSEVVLDTPAPAQPCSAPALRLDLRVLQLGSARLALLLTLQPRDAPIPAFDALGLQPHDAQALRAAVRQSQGLVVLAGPRGAGLTTTAYALLDTLGVDDAPDRAQPGRRRVQTIECRPARATAHWLQCAPALPGVVDGVAAPALTALAPDVLYLDALPGGAPAVPYLRQALAAVAEGAVVVLALRAERAHHVFCALRASGLPPADLAPHLSAVLAQRLVPRLCPHCAQPDSSAEVRAVLARAANSWLGASALQAAQPRPGGCAHCRGSGHRGRTLLYELLEIDAGTRALVEEGVVGLELEQRSLAQGRSIWDHGLRLLARGEISLATLRGALREP